jgi:ion channel POLLUX/CASTOR
MRNRAADRVKFWLERFLLRGPQYRLLFIAAVIGLMSVVAGALVLPSGTFDSWGEAIWWAFLRLSDPGYLGDDEGAWVRGVSTVLTVSGYVVFLGSLVAIMTQWLNATITRLESGLTPVTRSHHVLVLGWTNRTVAIIREMLLSEARVRRFLHLRGARQLHIVVLCEEVTPALRQDLLEQLGDLWDEGRITLRTGSALRVEHLERADFLHAGVILVPRADFGEEGAVALDARTVKTLLSISEAARGAAMAPPYLVAEIFDVRKLALARRAYGGPLELVASDAAIARLLAQNVRHPGLSLVYRELLSQEGEGNEIYLPEGDPFVGVPVENLASAFPLGVVLGVVRWQGNRIRTHLNPPPGLLVEEGDRIVVVARRFEDARAPNLGRPSPTSRGEPGTLVPHSGVRRILILGWSHKVPALLSELSTYRGEAFEVDVLSTVASERRETSLRGYTFDGERVRVRHLHGEYAVHSEVMALGPLRYDSVILVGGDRHRSPHEADARTVLGALLLKELTAKRERAPSLLVELLDPENAALLEGGRSEVLVTPILVSHVLAQVALRRELRAVFEELFTAGGPELLFRDPQEYGMSGSASFREISAIASQRGETALGISRVRTPAGTAEGDLPISGATSLNLNPDPSRRWELDQVRFVVLATYADPARDEA